MYKIMIGLIFLALTISCPVFASSEAEEAEEPAEQPLEASEEVVEESTGPLDTGHVCQLIRSLELCNNLCIWCWLIEIKLLIQLSTAPRLSVYVKTKKNFVESDSGI